MHQPGVILKNKTPRRELELETETEEDRDIEMEVRREEIAIETETATEIYGLLQGLTCHNCWSSGRLLSSCLMLQLEFCRTDGQEEEMMDIRGRGKQEWLEFTSRSSDPRRRMKLVHVLRCL